MRRADRRFEVVVDPSMRLMAEARVLDRRVATVQGLQDLDEFSRMRRGRVERRVFAEKPLRSAKRVGLPTRFLF